MAGQARVGTIVIGMRADSDRLSKDFHKARGELGAFYDFASKHQLNFRAAVQTANSLEVQFAKLGKATASTGPEFAKIADDIRQLSVSIKGVSLEQLIEIATTGAKLGVADADLLAYTEGIARLATAMDDIPSEVIADQIGKINSVFRLGVPGALKLGSAIDKLADSGVAASADILAVTQRASGTAQVAGLSAQETLAFATALLDTGTQAELAATTIQRLALALHDAESQTSIAKTLGVDVEEFKKLVETDAAGALTQYLSKIKELDATSQQIAIGGVLKKDAPQTIGEIQKLAQQIDSVAKYTALANHEFETLDQINKSYAITAGTASAGAAKFDNKMKLLSESLGQTFAPLQGEIYSFLGRIADIGSALVRSLAPTGKILAEALGKGLVGGVGMIADGFQVLKLSWLGFELIVLKGVQYLIRAIASLGRGIANVAEIIPGVKVHAADWLEGAANDLDKLASGASKEFNAELIKAPPSEGINKFFKEIQDGGAKAGGALDKTAKGLGKIDAAQVKLADDIGEVESRLKEQIALFGLDGAEAEVAKLRLHGATEAQAALAKTLAMQLGFMEKDKEFRKEQEDSLKQRKDDAKSLYEETRTPLEKYGDQIDELRRKFGQGDISEGLFKRGIDKASEELGKTPAPTAALELGSKEARSTILAFQRGGNDPGTKTADNTAKIFGEAVKQTRFLETLSRAVQGGFGTDTAPVF